MRTFTSLSPLVALLLAWSAGLSAQSPDVVAALRAGGHVLVMRHAKSPRETPTRDRAQPDNANLERQLDEEGRNGATAFGNALRALNVPVGTVLTSPAYRAVETVRFARLLPFRIVAELGDNGQSMQPITPAQIEWLRARVAERPESGNAVIVTHQPNLAAAFPDWGPSLAEGEIAIMKPDGRGGSTLVRRLRIEEWTRLTP
jgi:phosphohistidine phosphatase SixA